VKLVAPLDANRKELRNAVTQNLATAPATPVEGLRYYDTSVKVERYWNGTTWVAAAPVWVGPNAPPGTPQVGDEWYDTDDPNLFTLPLAIANGGTGQVTAASARSSLAVPAIGNSTTTAGAPTTGASVRGDLWLDSNNVRWMCTTGGTPGTWANMNIGEELAYNQITANVTITANSTAGANLIVEGTSRTYDGSPVLVEFFSGAIQPGTAQPVFNLWDASTDLGYVAFGGATPYQALYVRRRITPTPGTHNYRIGGWLNAGTGSSLVIAGAGGQNVWCPSFVRVTRA
jgi:hypothetical protein